MPTRNTDQRTHTHFHCCIKQISSLNNSFNFILPFQCSFIWNYLFHFPISLVKKRHLFLFSHTFFFISQYLRWVYLLVYCIAPQRRISSKKKWEDGRVEWAGGLNFNIFPSSYLFIDMASSAYPRQFCVTVCSRMKSRFGKNRRQLVSSLNMPKVKCD